MDHVFYPASHELIMSSKINKKKNLINLTYINKIQEKMSNLPSLGSAIFISLKHKKNFSTSHYGAQKYIEFCFGISQKLA